MAQTDDSHGTQGCVGDAAEAEPAAGPVKGAVGAQQSVDAGGVDKGDVGEVHDHARQPAEHGDGRFESWDTVVVQLPRRGEDRDASRGNGRANPQAFAGQDATFPGDLGTADRKSGLITTTAQLTCRCQLPPGRAGPGRISEDPDEGTNGLAAVTDLRVDLGTQGQNDLQPVLTDTAGLEGLRLQ